MCSLLADAGIIRAHYAFFDALPPLLLLLATVSTSETRVANRSVFLLSSACSCTGATLAMSSVLVERSNDDLRTWVSLPSRYGM